MTDLDDPSLRILRELENDEKTAPELSNRTNLSRGQVHYRLRNKLSDHVTQTDSLENPGNAAATTVWTISESGQEILEQTDDAPTTFDEIAEIADKSAQEAESAKESVRQYRKKVNRLKDRQGTLKGALPADSWDEVKRTKVASVDATESLSSHISGVERRLSEDIEEIDDDQDKIEGELDDLDANVSEVSDQLDELDDRLTKLASNIEDELEARDERISKLERRVETVESRSLWDLLPF